MKRKLIEALLIVLAIMLGANLAWSAEGLHILKGRSYLLQDEFTDAKAAGALDNTSTFPGGWVRDVATDTNSKLTTASGLLTFATGGAAAGDPGLWYTVKTRTSGMGIIAEVTPAGTTDASIAAGWDSNQAGALSNYLSFAASGALQAVVNGGTAVAVGAYTAASHKVALFQRATGYYAFVRFPTGFWKLVWIGAAGTDNLYPGISALGTAAVATVDYLRIPTQKYIPVPICYDTFDNATVAQDLTTHGSNIVGPDAQSTPARTWTGGTHWTINGVAKNSPVGGDETIADWNMDSGTPWSASGTPTTREKSTAIADHTSGSGQSMHIVADATSEGGASSAISVTAGNWYQLSCWVYPVSGAAVKCLRAYTDLDVASKASTGTAAWEQLVASGRAAASNATWVAKANSSGGSSEYYFDDFSFKPLALSDLLITHPSSTPDVLQSVVVGGTPSGTQAGLALNWDAGRTYGIICYIDGSTAKCDQNVNGTWSLITGVTGAITYGTAKVLTVWKSGAKIRLYYDSALVGAEGTLTDATLMAGTNHGLFSTYSTNTFDGYTIFPVGTSNEHSTLDIINQ